MEPVLEIDTGFVRGVVQKDEEGLDHYAFKGIPYGEPPIGPLRFEDPLPKKKWEGIMDCKNFGPLGFQYDVFTGVESYDEDCLHLNVYTHSINNSNQNNPVIVWIHGGEYSYGCADDLYCGPEYMMRKKIVLVTINFRLGVIGFLDLEDEIAPGNQGLKDQVMALQWVQKNIRVFGGNPNNVTVGGVTAGAVSAHYLSLSPLAKDLLHKIICHGHDAYNSWVAINNPRLHALKLCKILGKNLTDSKEIVSFLKTIDTKTLLQAQRRLYQDIDSIPFGPGIDSKSANPFMPVHRCTVADQGLHIPCLIGYATRAGIILFLDPFLFRRIPRKDFFEVCERDFGKMFPFDSQEILQRYNLSEKQARRLYYKSEKVSNENIDNCVDLLSDVHFIESIHRFVRVQAEQSSAATYLYRFDYESSSSPFRAQLKNGPYGVGHYDEQIFLFKLGFTKKLGINYFEKGSEDYRMMEKMTEMWVNFATHGRPTVETSELIPVQWQPVINGTILRYMNIGEDLTMQSVINIDQKFLSASTIKI